MFERKNRTRRLYDIDDSPEVDAVFVGFERLLGVASEGSTRQPWWFCRRLATRDTSLTASARRTQRTFDSAAG